MLFIKFGNDARNDKFKKGGEKKKKGEIGLKGGGRQCWQYNYGIIIIFL